MNRYRRWRQANPAKVLIYDAKRRAKFAGVPFALTLEGLENLLHSGWYCQYCSKPVGMFAGRGGSPSSATLDRIIPDKGYTPENTALACHACNRIKSEHTPASLREWADRIEAVINRMNPSHECGDTDNPRSSVAGQ